MTGNQAEGSRRYMDLLNLKDSDEAYLRVKQLASELTDDQHQIRSSIFDLHAAVEIELRRIYYHVFKDLLFLTADETKNKKTLAKFGKMIDRLGFMDMYRVLQPILNSWPYPDLQSIKPINDTRNAAAHGDINQVRYRDRNPFTDPDCFAQMYFDVWAIKQSIPKFFDWTIAGPREKLRRYYKRYGDI
ncbi:MAG: hypothetical protein SFV19_21170 [Rhodospirillaceae bacterium]|nr:hypothetical protein [Rhodospirillaceae bacterium]